MELLRKVAPRRPGTGMVIRIHYLSEAQGSLLDTRGLRRDPGAIPSVGQVDRLFRHKQASYQKGQRPEKTCHIDTLHKLEPRNLGRFDMVEDLNAEEEGQTGLEEINMLPDGDRGFFR